MSTIFDQLFNPNSNATSTVDVPNPVGYYKPLWINFAGSLALSAFVSLICMFIHEALRNKSDWRNLFAARCYLPRYICFIFIKISFININTRI
jgi:hypothetical protein